MQTQTDYAGIYDAIHAAHPGYNSAGGSPGYKLVLRESVRIGAARGPAVDVGCGAGFVVELLTSPDFGMEAYGVDVSGRAIAGAQERFAALGWDGSRLSVMEPGRIPMEEGRFGLVTCFDVLEHLDEADAITLIAELRRVCRDDGLIVCSVSCRVAGSTDKNGENLHRTVRDAAWWAGRIDPDEFTYRKATDDMVAWIGRG